MTEENEMATASQTIEQPTLPPAGNADSLAGVGPATSATEITSLKTSADIPNTTFDAFAVGAKEEIEELEKEIDDKAAEIIGQFKDRLETELVPLLWRMKRILPHGEWIPWYERFRKRMRIKASLRTVQRWFKELESGGGEDPVDDASDGTDDERDETEETTPVVTESPVEQLKKHCKQMSTALSSGDTDRALELTEDLALAINDGLFDPVPQASALRNEINYHTSKLTVVPLHHHQANEFVTRWHKHHGPLRVAKFSIGAVKNGELVAVAMCMRPASRHLDDGKTIEVARLATIRFDEEKDDEEAKKARKNACSFLYGRCARIATEMGYDKITTYLLDEEKAMTVRGAGWTLERKQCGGSKQGFRTNRPNGHEITPETFKTKQRWAKLLQAHPVSSAPVEDADDEADVA